MSLDPVEDAKKSAEKEMERELAAHDHDVGPGWDISKEHVLPYRYNFVSCYFLLMIINLAYALRNI